MLALTEEQASPELLPSPNDSRVGAVEVIESGAFVYALREDFEDEYVQFSFVTTSKPFKHPPPRSVTRRFEVDARDPVVVNTIDWEYVTTLPLPTGRLTLEILMMPRGRDGVSREAHYLRMVPPQPRMMRLSPV